MEDENDADALILNKDGTSNVPQTTESKTHQILQPPTDQLPVTSKSIAQNKMTLERATNTLTIPGTKEVYPPTFVTLQHVLTNIKSQSRKFVDLVQESKHGERSISERTLVIINRLFQNIQLTVVDSDGKITATTPPNIFPLHRQFGRSKVPSNENFGKT